MRTSSLVATADIASEWNGYISNTPRATHAAAASANQHLCPATWNQSPYYNAYCPGGSVTGCVATAMAQIMRYWKYPSIGSGSHCYMDGGAYYSENYGQQCAEFDTSRYVWSAMPTQIDSVNPQIAKLMYDCGVSVDMDYSPTGSAAEVMGGGQSAYSAYTAYFGYDPNTISVAYYQNYQDSAWFELLKNEFVNGRPVQFQGFDPNEGGHSWVCDGYSVINTVYMNWGWGGFDNGWYRMDKLDPDGLDLLQVWL